MAVTRLGLWLKESHRDDGSMPDNHRYLISLVGSSLFTQRQRDGDAFPLVKIASDFNLDNGIQSVVDYLFENGYYVYARHFDTSLVSACGYVPYYCSHWEKTGILGDENLAEEYDKFRQKFQNDNFWKPQYGPYPDNPSCYDGINKAAFDAFLRMKCPEKYSEESNADKFWNEAKIMSGASKIAEGNLLPGDLLKLEGDRLVLSINELNDVDLYEVQADYSCLKVVFTRVKKYQYSND